MSMEKHKINKLCEVFWESHLVLQETIQTAHRPDLEEWKAFYEMLLVRMFDLLDVEDEYWEPIGNAFLTHELVRKKRPNAVSNAYYQPFLKLIEDLRIYDLRTDRTLFWEEYIK